MRDLAPVLGACIPNNWTAREFPEIFASEEILTDKFILYHQIKYNTNLLT